MSEIPRFDVKAEDLPFAISYIDADTDELLHVELVESPGVIDVPGFAPRRVTIRIDFHTGESIVAKPDPIDDPEKE